MSDPALIDAGFFDMLTIFVGIVVVLFKFWMRWTFDYRPVVHSRAGVDFMHGCVVFPFLILILLPFCSWISPYVHSTNFNTFVEMVETKNLASIALAAGVGLFYVLGQLLVMDD